MANTRRKMVSGVFRDRVNAQAAYDWLINRGYTGSEINVLMSDTTRSTYFPNEMNERQEAKTHATEGVGIGGAIGTAVGAGLAAALAIGTSIMLPGIGWVAGPIAAAFAGGGAGAVTGVLVGGLVGLGIPESNAAAYEQALREGGVVIGVTPHNDDDADAMQKHFEELRAENICFC